MSQTDISPETAAAEPRGMSLADRLKWRGGLVETVAALRYREAEDYEAWLELRDTTTIATTLSRLSERQLKRIGLSHDTLILDIEDLKEAAQRNREIGDEVLNLVEPGAAGADASEEQHRFAAE